MGCDLQRYQRRASHLRAGQAPDATLPPVTVPGGTDAGGRPVTGTRRGSALQSADPRRLGPFALAARLGSGGMGVVYLARHDAGHEAAVKVVHPHLVGDPDFRVRFAREIAVARSVDAPWTARVLDADPHGERPWLATEFVDGPALDEQVARAGGLPRSALEILGRRLAEALAGLHAGGVVHRDLKPSNVLLGTDGPRLIDFGIARSIDATKITHTGLVMGTPAYMAPEQAEGEESGPPADVFALASVLFFAATGAGPFGTASHPAAMLLRILQRTPDTAELPAPLDQWLRPCFAKDPAERPTAAELVDAWAPQATPTLIATKLVERPNADERPSPSERAPRLLVAANAVLALLIAAAIVLAFFPLPTTATAPQQPAARPDGALPQIAQVAELPMGGRVGGIAATRDGRTLMVMVDGGIRFVDTATRAVTPRVALPDGVSGASFAPDGNRIYLAGRGIRALDVRSGAVTGAVGDTSNSGYLNSFAIDPDGRTAYATFRLRTDLAVIDLTDGREIGAVPIGTTDSRVSWVGDGRVAVIGGIPSTGPGQADDLLVDTAARKVIGTLPTFAHDVDATGDRAFVLLAGGKVAIVDAASGKPTGSPLAGLPSSASSVVVSPDGHTMTGWGSLREPTVLHIADTDGVPRQDVETGGEIRGVGFAPDGRTMYVSVGKGRDTVLVFDTGVLVR